MAAIYLHKILVTVITTECSPDAVERIIDKACSDAGMRADARTNPENRRFGPSKTIANAPEYPTGQGRQAELAWAEAHDQWLDSWPREQDFG